MGARRAATVRRGLGVVLVALVVGTCSGGSEGSAPPSTGPGGGGAEEDHGGDRGGRSGDKGPGECLVDGRSLDADVDLGTLDVVNHHLRMIAVGDVLLAAAFVETGVERQGPDVVRSTNCGATWERVELPGAPAMPGSGMNETLTLVGDTAMITAEIHLDPTPGGDDTFIWTSTDGEDWQGGPVTVPSPDDALAVGTATPWQLPDGRLVVPLDLTLDAPQPVLVSDDGGASWQVAECPAASRHQLGTQSSCWRLVGAGGLWARSLGEVSLDEARTWQRPALEPEPPDLSDFPKIDALVAPGAGSDPGSAGGGWVATFTADVQDCPSFSLSGVSTCVAYLARSDDGVRWEATLDLHDDCWGHAEVDEPNSLVTDPVPVGEGWLVVYTCADGGTPRWSRAYTVDAGGQDPKLIVETDEPGMSLGQPAAIADGIVMPEIDPGGRSATLLQLLP